MPQATLRELIRAAGRDNGLAPLEHARQRLDDAGFTLRQTEGERPALVAERAGTDGAPPRLVLSGHVDVVPVGDGWTHDPFGGDEADGRIWGRGACDMLGAVACFLDLADNRRDLPLAVALTTDEETGMHGAEVLVEEGMLDGYDAVVVGEPTDFEVGIAEKGVLWARVVARGKNAHASMPSEGENAIDGLVDALARVRAVPLPGEHPLLGPATRSLGVIRGGSLVNVVPDRAEAEIDHRYLPGTDGDALLREFEQAAAPDAAIEVMSHHPPFETSADSPVVDACVRAVAAERGATEPVGMPYGTEASRFQAVEGLDVVILGPGERALAHTSHESIRLTDLEAGYRVYERVADAYAAGAKGA